MNTSKYFIFVIAITATGFFLFLTNKFLASDSQSSPVTFEKKITTKPSNMKITSPSFENNGSIPPKFTCYGEGINPQLALEGVPKDTLSLALIAHDPDAPGPGGFTHWIIFNMSPALKEIRENSKPPSGTEGTNSGGKIGWTSPCPPSGIHHYHFTLYALDEVLKFNSSAKKTDIEKAIAGHIIEQTELVGLCQRQ